MNLPLRKKQPKMNFTTNVLIFTFLLISSLQLSAQVVKEKSTRATQRTEYKVDQKVDQKIDQAVDDAFDKVSSLFKRKKKKKHQTTSREENQITTESETRPNKNQRSNQQSNPFFYGSNQDATLEKKYQFHTIVTVHTTTTKKSGKVKNQVDFDWMLANQGELFGLSSYDKKSGKSAIIIDHKNNIMITIMEKEKKAMTFSIKQSMESDDADETLSDDVTIKKTGRTKSILGYSCSEYTMDSKDMLGTFWMTTQLKALDFSKMPKRMKKQKNEPWINLGIDGLMMESKMTEKGKKGYTYNSIATAVNKHGKTFLMSNYEVMSLGSFGF